MIYVKNLQNADCNTCISFDVCITIQFIILRGGINLLNRFNFRELNLTRIFNIK